jgi:FkbM family methyltransferase
MFDYFKQSFARKKARRVFSKYPYEITSFQLPTEGTVQFANWKNPLVEPKIITQDEINFVRKFAPKGSFCIDIGTNIGDTTVPMALAVGKDGLTLGFDPNPLVFEILEVNATLNPDKTNIVPVPYAVMEEEGEFYYASSEASFGNGGLSTEESNPHGNYKLDHKVKGVNLEKYLDEHYTDWLPKLSLIKVDVEGFDKDVLRSISSLVARYKPMLIAECFSKASIDERQELYQVVADMGYDLYYFADFDEKAEVVKLAPNDMSRWKNFNFYATPK